ncbi:hypothetical protein [Paenibacillus sp. DR312]|uniref:coiled-coil domain-containing protein n=1 Tax=Paenibacillus sp. DR312 TaxID=2871175 RepID=UPI001C9474E4|nr:hypothetical protein [Paenibacillus sp. DR312]QZN75502.1 hypothetical protein K5K90_29790 [Paenibacillus sp. DR312]
MNNNTHSGVTLRPNKPERSYQLIMVIIGGLLSLYAVVVIVLLFIVRAKVVAFLDRLAKRINQILLEIIRALTKIFDELEQAKTHLDDFVNRIIQDIEETLAKLKTLIGLLTTKMIPEAVSAVRDFALDLYQSPFWISSDVLNELVNKDLIPEAVVNKLKVSEEQAFESEAELRDFLAKQLTPEENIKYADAIVLRAINPKTNEGMVRSLIDARESMAQIGNETVPAVSQMLDTMIVPIGAIFIMTGIIAGPAAGALTPFVVEFGLMAQAVLPIVQFLQKLKIGRGALGSISIPPKDITLPILGGGGGGGGRCPWYNPFCWSFSLPKKVKRGDFANKIVIPRKLAGIGIREGQWGSIAIPSSDSTVFGDLSDVEQTLQEIRDFKDQWLNTLGTLTGKYDDIKERLKEVSDKLAVSGTHIADLATNPERLPKQIDNLKKQSKSLLKQGDNINELIFTLNDTLSKIEDEAEDVKKALFALAGDLKERIDRIKEQIKHLLQIFQGRLDVRTPLLRVTNYTVGFVVAIHVAFLLIGIWMLT